MVDDLILKTLSVKVCICSVSCKTLVDKLVVVFYRSRIADACICLQQNC